MAVDESQNNTQLHHENASARLSFESLLSSLKRAEDIEHHLVVATYNMRIASRFK
jgi:hypothetical protein